MRGSNVTEQPVNNNDQNITLCWNGEVFGSTVVNVGDEESDTVVILRHLSECW
jgi:asparagine synthetase B (glutamine-hydrolysing)